jgi:hypothetical protein
MTCLQIQLLQGSVKKIIAKYLEFWYYSALRPS